MKHKDDEARQKLARKAAKSGFNQGGRHVIFCVSSGCAKDKGEAKTVAKMLHSRAKELRKSGVSLVVSQSDCLKLCVGGPILCVQPDGVWYGRVTPEICERIIEEHLIGGQILEEFVIARR